MLSFQFCEGPGTNMAQAKGKTTQTPLAEAAGEATKPALAPLKRANTAHHRFLLFSCVYLLVSPCLQLHRSAKLQGFFLPATYWQQLQHIPESFAPINHTANPTESFLACTSNLAPSNWSHHRKETEAGRWGLLFILILIGPRICCSSY